MKKILLIIFLFLCCTNVYALEKRFTGGEFLKGISYLKYDGKIYYYRNEKVIRNSDTNEIAYCIAPFDDLVDNSSYMSAESYDPNFGISRTNWEKVKLISYYGYGYKNHTENKWISITQMLIWRTLYPNYTFEWLDNTDSRNIIKPYNSELEELISLVNSHDFLPGIEKNQVFNKNTIVALTDYNNVLSNYVIKSSDFEASISGNSLLFDVGSIEREGKIVLERASNIYQGPMLYFYNSASQSIIERGNIKPITYEINIKVTNGKININKLDYDTENTISQGEASLDGAVYGLYNSNKALLYEKPIVDNKLSFENLTFGKYYVQEIKPGIGYSLDNNIYEVILNESNIIKTLNLKNKAIKYRIKINKLDYDNESIIPQGEASLDGAIYALYDSNMNKLETKTIENNELIFDGLLYGKYYIKEEKAGVGYLLDDKIYEVMFDNDSNEQMLTLTNKAIKYKIKVNKLDYDNESTVSQGEASLDGTIYGLYDSNMNKLETKTIENNELTFDDLPYGKYYIKEEAPGVGYLLDDEIYEVTFDNNSNEQVLILKDQAIKSKITITKYYGTKDDFENGNMQKEQDAYFEVYDLDNTFIDSGYTDNNGELIFNLPYGKYIIKQLTSKDGYQKVDDYYLTIDENSSYSVNITFNDFKIEVPNAYIGLFSLLWRLLYA